MRAALQLEWIGWDRGHNDLSTWRRPWVARIRGTHGVFGFDREFLEPYVSDFSNSNSRASRGLFLRYVLPPGLYEIRGWSSWRSEERYFVRSADGKIIRICRDEAVSIAEDLDEQIEAFSGY